MIVYKDIQQRSPKWKELRLGTVTGTRLKGIFASNNLPLIDELISEELTGYTPEVFVNDAMQRGIDLEPVAMEEYESREFVVVDTPAFVRHSELDFIGFSPDGLIMVGDKYIGGVEIKCPSSKKHIEYIRINRVPNEYKYQVLAYFINCPDLEYVDFVSYDDRVELKPFHMVRAYHKDWKKDIEEAVEGIKKFNEKRAKYFAQITDGKG